MRNDLFYSMAMDVLSLPYDERRALASLSDTEGYAFISAVQRWCRCDEAMAKSHLLSLYLKGYIVEDLDERLWQPQMILAQANAIEAPVTGRYKIRAGNISWQRRAKIRERDGHKCVYCGASGEGVRLTIDHKIPKSKGGLTTDENLATACSPCNLRKDASDLDEFLEELAAEHARSKDANLEPREHTPQELTDHGIDPDAQRAEDLCLVAAGSS